MLLIQSAVPCIFFVNIGIEVVVRAAQGSANALTGSAGGLFILVSSIGLSLLLAWIFKKLFRKYSRMLVGG